MSEPKIDLAKYENHLGRKHQMIRLLWNITWSLCASWMPRSIRSGWKRFLLRTFGAKMGKNSHVYSSAKIYYPSNLVMGNNTSPASDVDCYNVAPIIIEDNVTVSQGAYLCTSRHDIENSKHQLITAPIVLNNQAWKGARAFIGMGATIGQGAVVGAPASVYKEVEFWTLVEGNPAKFMKKRAFYIISSDMIKTEQREAIYLSIDIVLAANLKDRRAVA